MTVSYNHLHVTSELTTNCVSVRVYNHVNNEQQIKSATVIVF